MNSLDPVVSGRRTCAAAASRRTPRPCAPMPSAWSSRARTQTGRAAGAARAPRIPSLSFQALRTAGRLRPLARGAADRYFPSTVRANQRAVCAPPPAAAQVRSHVCAVHTEDDWRVAGLPCTRPIILPSEGSRGAGAHAHARIPSRCLSAYTQRSHVLTVPGRCLSDRASMPRLSCFGAGPVVFGVTCFFDPGTNG